MNSKIGNIMVKDIDDDKIDVFLLAKVLKKKKTYKVRMGKLHSTVEPV